MNLYKFNIRIILSLFTILLLLKNPIRSQDFMFETSSGITIGNTDDENQKPGTIRWTGSDFEGWDGNVWKSLTTGYNFSNGDLFVTVKSSNYRPMAGANVFTSPNSVQGVTDEFGSVLLRGLQKGSYEIFASTNTAVGKSVVYITEEALHQLNVILIDGAVIGITPTITLILPDTPGEFTASESIPFSADLKDKNTPYNELQVTWESDIDGVFNTDIPNASGNTSFSHNLSQGLHNVTLTVTNNDGYISSIDFQISTLSPSSIHLNEVEKSSDVINISWEEYSGDDFLKYDVFRGTGTCNSDESQLIASISAIDSTNITDKGAPLDFRACYYVRVTNNQGYTRNSNLESIDFPSGVVFDFTPYDFKIHPKMPWAYLLDQAGQKMVKYNYNTQEILNEINLETKIGYFDIGDNGMGYELYLPGQDGQIYIYDADAMTFVDAINTGLSTESVVTNGGGYVVASVRPSPWWEDPIRTYDRETGLNLSGNGDHAGDRIRMRANFDQIITISTSVSPIDMEFLEMDTLGYITWHVNDSYHGSHPLNPKIFRISDLGNYSITSSYGALYTANQSMEYKGILQRGSLLYSDFAFSDDEQKIYAGTSNRKSIQIGNTQSLLRSGEIITKGYPYLIEKKNQKLIVVSKGNMNKNHTGVEIINIESP